MKKHAATLIGVPMANILSTAGTVFAEAESGSKNCGNYIAYTHVRFKTQGYYSAPGESGSEYHDYGDGLWHVDERNGAYSGFWYASSEVDLDQANTWAACRPYGAPQP